MEPTGQDGLRLEVTLERSEIIRVCANDEEMLEEFIRAMMRRGGASPFA